MQRTTTTGVEGRKEVQTTRLLFPIKLHRRPLYYVVNLVVPTIILALLSAGVFIIPADSGEKLSYIITILLAFFIFLLLLSDNIPPSAGAGPLLGKLHRCSFDMLHYAPGVGRGDVIIWYEFVPEIQPCIKELTTVGSVFSCILSSPNATYQIHMALAWSGISADSYLD